MAIPAELIRYATEERFRDEFLVPLFLRFGFSAHNYHGTREFGKDILLGKIDEFGERSYYGVQAKYDNSISQSGVSDLLKDVREAFDNPFRHPQDGTEHRIARFYIVNGGGISDQARETFFNGIHEPARKANTQLIDGKALLYLNRFASFSRTGLIREQLTAVLIEVRVNLQVMNNLQKLINDFVNAKGSYPLARLQSHACGTWLGKPPISDGVFYGAIHDYLVSIQMLNYIADSIDQIIHAPDYLAARNNGFNTVCETASSQGAIVEQQTTAMLRLLAPLV